MYKKIINSHGITLIMLVIMLVIMSILATTIGYNILNRNTTDIGDLYERKSF